MTYSMFATKRDINAGVFVEGSMTLLRMIPSNKNNKKKIKQTFDESCQYKNQVHEIMAARKKKKTPKKF